MTQELISEINKRFKKALTKDPSVLTCIITGQSRPSNAEYLEKKASIAGSKENFIKHYICREALTLLKSGKTVDEIRQTFNVQAEYPVPDTQKIKNALIFNGK